MRIYTRSRVYLTVNTLMKEKEITGQLYDFLLPFYEAGLDALSCRIWERRLLSVGISRRWKCTGARR